ncbi:MAG TPA: hypothetical protein VGA02_06400 [Gemmatimonadales bacterium]|jgi:hypothetical protein
MKAARTEAWLFAAVTPDVQPGVMPAVRARVACPETGGLSRVRLAVDPVSGIPAVVWCDRYDQRPMTCRRGCLEPEPALTD